MIIGLTGYAGVGKDTIADVLVRKHGFKRLAFADPLREMLYALNPIVDRWQKDGRPERIIRVKDLVDKHGWDKAKRLEPEIRELLQRLGTEAGRNILGQHVWIEALDDIITNRSGDGEDMRNVVIPDCRFENEARYIGNQWMGAVVRVVRPGHGPINGHVSDAGLPHSLIDLDVVNDGSLDDLEQKAVVMLEALKC